MADQSSPGSKVEGGGGAAAPPPAPYGMPYGAPVSPARTVFYLLLVAFVLAAVGLLIRYITGFMDDPFSSGVRKARLAGTLIFAYATLTLSLSLFWGAYRVFEGQAVRLVAVLVGFAAFLIPFLLWNN